MKYEELKKLIDDISASDLMTFNIEFPDGTKVSMSKLEEAVQVVTTPAEKSTESANKTTLAEESEKDTTPEEKEEPVVEGNIVKSPMIGTFYSKPSPTSDPYVEVGSKVTKGQTLCIIEAMKLMNEIESEYDGEVVEVLIKDGENVEYGTPLFKIN